MTEPADSGSPLVYRGVTKTYKTHFWERRQTSLVDLDLDVRRGEILGLLGPNGAGKTTTIKLALGLIFPDGGSVTLMGRTANDPAARTRVGYLPEAAYYPDDLTGRELVELAARLHGVSARERRARAASLLARVGLSRVADRPLRKYSKGMVQRAGMARALVGEPRFLILDEPMSGLDPIGRREFRDLILELRRGGVTVLFASHVLSDAEMLCNRVAILKGGRLVAVSDLSQLERERRLRHWEVEARGASEIPGAELVSRRGEEALFRLPPSFTAEQALGAVRSAGGRLEALVPCRESLEDLFLRTLAEEQGEPGR
ncbi:MAG: ABC transporter ATP-binding protein [Acidobacteriota bacterium]|nr:ABC transporter ATP-binding protein [Acidobacteriota bacterium]